MLKIKQYAWLLLLPSFFYLWLVILGPWLYASYLMATDLSFIRPGATGNWIADQHLWEMFHDPKFYHSMKVALTIAIPALAIEVIMGLLIAYLFYTLGESRKRRVLVAVYTIPFMLSSSVVALVWYFMFQGEYGILSYYGRTYLGLFKQYGLWADPNLVVLGYILIDVWEWAPFVVLCFLAAMTALPLEPIESARVSGANEGQIFRRIIIPMLKPIFGVIILLRSMDLFKVFDPIYIITYGGPGDVSEALHVYAFRQGFRLWDIGYSSTIGTFMFLVVEVFCALFCKFYLARAYRR